MKKMTTFFTIALLVCIAIFVAFAANQNRDVSRCFLVVANPDDNLPHEYSDVDCTGTDSEGPLWSTGSSWSGYYRNDNGELRYGASGYGYVSCSTDNDNYETRYTVHAKVPENLQFPNERNPQTVKKFGSFSESITVDGEGDGMFFNMGGASGSASARGKNPSNGDQHNTSAASPTPSNARDLEIIPADSSSPVAPTPTPADGTPNCPDCTSHCSSPCSCTNSGTCNGTVSYHACGNHETSVSGDHSLQASCSASNANGSCTVSGFYACDGHSHVYPSPPDPPSPTLCPANSWTGCGSTTSDATTCGSGHTYYTCNPSAVSWHTADRTCSRTGCNATYTDCSRGSETKHCLGKYKWHK